MPKRKTIGFRVDSIMLRKLEERAKRLGVTTHDLARRLVKEKLDEGEEFHRLLLKVIAIYDDIQAMRTDLLLSTRVILVNVGKFDQEKARIWTEENMGKGAKRC